MIKYYKADDVIRFLNINCPKDMWEYQIADLPTLEVSEDAISRANLIESFLADNECKREEAKACMCSLDLMLELIDDEPSVIPQVPSEDCISREYMKSFEYINKGDFNSVETIREWIDDAPSVIPQPKEGEWIYKGNSIDPIWNCSECGKQIICSKSELPNYCEDCGAKMKGGDDDKD